MLVFLTAPSFDFFFANYLIQSRPRTCSSLLPEGFIKQYSIALHILFNHHLVCARVSHPPRKSILYLVGTGCSRPRSRSKVDPCEEFDERPDFAQTFRISQRNSVLLCCHYGPQGSAGLNFVLASEFHAPYFCITYYQSERSLSSSDPSHSVMKRG